MPESFYLTYVLIGINVLVFFYLQSNPLMVNRMLLISGRVTRNKEYDRLFLSGFTHVSFMHILFNCLTLYYFGRVVEIIEGGTLFLLIFLGSIIAGNLYSIFMRKEDSNYAALGASGGVLGVIFAFILRIPDAKLSLFLLPIGIPGWIFGIIFSITSIVLTQLPRAEEARISHEGHLGGALFGGLFALALQLPDGLSPQQLYFVLGGIVPIALFALVKLLAPGSIYKHLR
jgi:membrane associated rhomboid family serine protease